MAADTGNTGQDRFALERFVSAQDNGVYERALAELEAGEKRTHWMWFIFPQVQGLGSSEMAQHYAIAGRAEAEAYLTHPVLGERLLRCTEAVNGVTGRAIGQIFGYPDDLKFRSSMTLFAACAINGDVFTRALQIYFGGEPDPATLVRV